MLKWTEVLVLLCDHEVRGLEEVLTHVQHHYSQIIFSTMHIRLTETDCLEAIAARGEAAEIRKLSNELSSKEGVKMLKTTIVSV